jgi:hypothetical protein
MAEELEGRDLRDAVFWGVDLSRAHFRDVDLTDVTISHARVVNVDIDGLVDHVTINGVDVTAYVNERDPWHPLRAQLRPADPPAMRAAWQALEQAWATTIARARRLPEARLHESVGGEWSFVRTLRHLVFAMDKWFAADPRRRRLPPDRPAELRVADFGWPGLDRGADPTFDEVLAVRADRADRLREYLERVTPADLAREVDVLENGTTPVDECLFTVFEEEFEHNRYAVRDLALID